MKTYFWSTGLPNWDSTSLKSTACMLEQIKQTNPSGSWTETPTRQPTFFWREPLPPDPFLCPEVKRGSQRRRRNVGSSLQIREPEQCLRINHLSVHGTSSDPVFQRKASVACDASIAAKGLTSWRFKHQFSSFLAVH